MFTNCLLNAILFLIVFFLGVFLGNHLGDSLEKLWLNHKAKKVIVVVPKTIPLKSGKLFNNLKAHALKISNGNNKVYFGVHRNTKGHLSTFFIEVPKKAIVDTNGIYYCIM